MEEKGVASSAADVVCAAFVAYRDQGCGYAARLLAPECTFVGPLDDHLDRDVFMVRCSPTTVRFISQEILARVELGGGNMFLLYEYELRTGKRHRNTEFGTVRGGQLVRTDVFLGGRVG